MTEKEIDNLEGEQNNETHESDNSPDEEAKSKRHAQQMAGAKAEVERLEKIALESQVKLVGEDANNLIELAQKDPKLAEKVARHFGYSSYEDAEAKAKSILGQSMEKKEVDDFETKYQKKRAEERHQESLEAVDKYLKKSKLSETLKEQAQTYFEKITKGKQLTVDEALEFADMATLYVSKDKLKSEAYEKGIADYASNGMSQQKKPTNDNDLVEVVENGRIVLVPNKQING